MPARGTPLFLARRSYRRRRLMDAARMLPVLGAFLVALPILWPPAGTPGAETAAGGVYLFTVWALLIAAAAMLARRLGPAPEDEAPEDEAREEGAPEDGAPEDEAPEDEARDGFGPERR